MMLSDVWINPIVQPSTPEQIRARCEIYDRLFRSFGIEGLIDQEIVDTLVRYTEMAHPRPWTGRHTTEKRPPRAGSFFLRYKDRRSVSKIQEKELSL